MFIDQNKINEVFGQKLGSYHGFREDQPIGGTYNPNPRNKPIVDDFNNYIRRKIDDRNIGVVPLKAKTQKIDLKSEADRMGIEWRNRNFNGQAMKIVDNYVPRGRDGGNYNNHVLPNINGRNEERNLGRSREVLSPQENRSRQPSPFIKYENDRRSEESSERNYSQFSRSSQHTPEREIKRSASVEPKLQAKRVREASLINLYLQF